LLSKGLALLSQKQMLTPVTPVVTNQPAAPLEQPQEKKGKGRTGWVISSGILLLILAAAAYVFFFHPAQNKDLKDDLLQKR